MTVTLRVLSYAAFILGLFWCAYSLLNGFQTDRNPSYFLPQAARFLFWGISGWAVFGSLGNIMARLDKLEDAART